MTSAAISLLLLLLLLPLLLTGSNLNINLTQSDQQATTRNIEQEVLYCALQAAIARISFDGGAREMRFDFPESGLRVYVFSELEPIAGLDRSFVRLRAAARPLTDQPGLSPNFTTNNTLVATAAFDFKTQIATEVRFIDVPRSPPP